MNSLDAGGGGGRPELLSILLSARETAEGSVIKGYLNKYFQIPQDLKYPILILAQGPTRQDLARLDGNHGMTNKRETPLFMICVAARSNACVARLTTGVTSVTASHYPSPDWSVILGEMAPSPHRVTQLTHSNLLPQLQICWVVIGC